VGMPIAKPSKAPPEAGFSRLGAPAHRLRALRPVPWVSRQMVTRGGHPSGHFQDGHRDPILYLTRRRRVMTNIVYIVGAIVIVVAVLSFFGLR
jgi:hypothetical protein